MKLFCCSGKEVWSLSVEKDGKLSGLILSEDGRVAIADIPQTVDEMTSERTEQKTLDAKLYCFDIKVLLTPVLENYYHSAPE